jgi:type II secretory pathway pseudopilin PulG
MNLLASRAGGRAAAGRRGNPLAASTVVRKSLASSAGFTFPDLMVVVGIIGVLAAISIPPILTLADSVRLQQTAREVERELQTAKQRAVANKRPIRLRFNCPAAGQYRLVELVGSARSPAADDDPTSIDRCRTERYPFPAQDADPATRPNLDGPVRRLDPTVSFGAVQTIEFWSDGTAHWDTGVGTPWVQLPVTGTTLTLTRASKTASITVNGLGKVQLLRIQ